MERGYLYLEAAVKAVEGPTCWVKLAALESVNEQLLCQEFGEFLDPGESSCLVVAISRGMVLATDDIAARRLATRRNVSLTGTLGLLIELIKHKAMTLEKANEVLSRMIEAGYRSPCERLEELICIMDPENWTGC